MIKNSDEKSFCRATLNIVSYNDNGFIIQWSEVRLSMETKICSKCEIPQSIEKFTFKDKKNGVRRAHCQDCQSRWFKHHYKSKKQYYISRNKVNNAAQRINTQKMIYDHLLTNPCVDCGETNPIVLDFDHVKDKKSFNVSTAVKRGLLWKKIMNEIAKCEVRCSNCHRMKTSAT